VSGTGASLGFADVALRFGRAEVLRGVTLGVAAGEVLGLVGRNGAGKTTLLRVATRVLRPDRGSVEIGGRPLEAWSRRELARRVAVVPQQTLVPFPFTVAEVVLMGRAPHQPFLGFDSPGDVAIAARALDRLGIAHLAERSVLGLSGGERQLALVARALAQEAELLLLDEPTAFLDLEHRLAVLELVRERSREGKSALVVSHDLALAARFCDRIAILSGGRVLAAGAPRDVLDPPRLREAFGIEADVVSAPDGSPLVVPRRAAR
jgi:iron complex transport system ATP-binding protein